MKQTLPKLLAGLAAVLWAAVAPFSTAAPPHTGIQGQAFLYISYGPPIEVEPGVWISVGDVQLPVATSFAVLAAQTGREVARVTTDANGVYVVPLPPGNYVLASEPLSLGPGCFVSKEPFSVAVRPRQVTPLNIFYFHAGPPCVVQASP